MTPNMYQSKEHNMTVKQGVSLLFQEKFIGTKNERNQRSLLAHIENHFGSDTRLSALDERKVYDWVQFMRSSGLAPGTINRRLSSLSVLLRTAHEEWLILERKPKVKFQSEKGNGRTRWLTYAEESRLLSKTNGDTDMRNLIIVLIDTGMRLSEALKLQPMDVDLDQGLIRLYDTKEGRPRGIPMTTRVKKILGQEIRQGETHLFSTPKRTIQAKFAAIRKDAKLDDVVLHSLRHTFASRLVQSGIDLYRVSRLMGHSSIKVTERYAHLAPIDLQQAITVMEEAHKRHTTMPPTACKP